jgi:hypothetical protein
MVLGLHEKSRVSRCYGAGGGMPARPVEEENRIDCYGTREIRQRIYR